MWKAISKHTRTEIANARLSDVTTENPKKEDSMESFWLAETLKYFYLLFSETGTVNLDEFVLWVPLPFGLRKIPILLRTWANDYRKTEAHPFRQQDHLLT